MLGGLFATGLVLFLLVQIGQGIERDQEVASAYTPAYSAPFSGCDGRSGLPDLLAPNDPWIYGGETCLAWAQGKTEQQQFNEHKALYAAFIAALSGYPLNTQLGRDEAQWLKGVEDSDPAEFRRIMRQYGTEIVDASTQGGAK
ncbi:MULTISPECIES: hypothetical protein [Burkholderia]|uniref:hypothetical protein n=1 Tax=Burkholderia TaxID=32008 RepID=UPI00164129BA|nr:MULTISPECIES: hypothetical protein [Burkholderia]